MLEHKIPKVSAAVQENFAEVIAVIKSFCDTHLNNEYYDLALRLATRIARKKLSPLLSGNTKTWAAGIIHALGMVNFLFDKSQEPYISSQNLATWFNLSQSTISTKSKSIRDMFKIRQLDPSWTLPSDLESNPLVWMIQINGFIIDVRYAPYELQVEAYNAGLIPHIPADKKVKISD